MKSNEKKTLTFQLTFAVDVCVRFTVLKASVNRKQFSPGDRTKKTGPNNNNENNRVKRMHCSTGGGGWTWILSEKKNVERHEKKKKLTEIQMK